MKESMSFADMKWFPERHHIVRCQLVCFLAVMRFAQELVNVN